MNGARTIEVAIHRFEPGHDRRPRWQRYELAVAPGMTVLEVLHALRERQDPTLAWRSSCRMGVCGACGMVVNGVPRLACSTQALDVARASLRLEALWNFPIVRDLVVDGRLMTQRHASIEPWVVRYEEEGPVDAARGESQQTPAQLDQYLQFASCIKCGLCMAACPTMATDTTYLGPMPLTAAHRYNADSRDRGFDLRKARLGALGGAFHCHYAGECSRVCPKGVDPARAIQLLKRALVADYLGLRRSGESGD
jgi:succinate dehydrogenase / fumarate reductase iron-sulfur subunit